MELYSDPHSPVVVYGVRFFMRRCGQTPTHPSYETEQSNAFLKASLNKTTSLLGLLTGAMAKRFQEHE